jgi:hypothetical protein
LFYGHPKSFAQNISELSFQETSRPIEGTYVFNELLGSKQFYSEVEKFVIPKTNTGDILRIGSIGYETQYVTLRAERLKHDRKEKSVELSAVVQMKLDAPIFFPKST